MLVSRGPPAKILFEGKTVEAFEGEPIAMALYRYGLRTFSRSLKYRKSRGLLCLSGACAQCMLNVDRIPNVRTCITPATDGMTVKRQRGWPSADHDLISFFLGMRELEAGFQYKAGLTLWPLFMWAYTRLTGAGTLDTRNIPDMGYEYKETQKDVVIIGGGPAGLGAAFEFAQSPLDFTLIEQMPWLGGERVLLEGGDTEQGSDPEVRRMQDIASSIDSLSKLLETTAVGFYRPNKVLAVRHYKELYQFQAKRFVLATGGYEDIPLIENSDIPGFFTYRGALIMLKGFGVKPGERGVVIGSGERARLVRKTLEGAGIPIAEVAPADVVRIGGARRVRAIVTRDKNGIRRKIEADFAVAADGINPRCELSYQAGAEVNYDEKTRNYVTSHDDSMRSTEVVYTAGSMCGSQTYVESFRQGRIAALSIAHDLTGESKYASKILELTGKRVAT